MFRGHDPLRTLTQLCIMMRLNRAQFSHQWYRVDQSFNYISIIDCTASVVMYHTPTVRQ